MSAAADHSVDQLVAATVEFDDRAAALFARLAAIEAVASGNGVEVRVNLEGRLVGLTLSAAAVAGPASALAEEISRLTHEAAAEALAEGLAALAPVVGAELTAELAELVATCPAAPSRTDPDPAEEPEPERWALPR